MSSPAKRYLQTTLLLFICSVLSIFLFLIFSWSFKLPKVLGLILWGIFIAVPPLSTYLSIKRFQVAWWFPPLVFLSPVILLVIADFSTANTSSSIYILLGSLILFLTLPAALIVRGEFFE